MVVADEIGGDNRFIGVLDDTLVWTFSGSLDDGLDLIVRSGLLEAYNEIDDGDVESGDTERETPIFTLTMTKSAQLRLGWI